jgi:hypothetical protein
MVAEKLGLANANDATVLRQPRMEELPSTLDYGRSEPSSQRGPKARCIW